MKFLNWFLIVISFSLLSLEEPKDPTLPKDPDMENQGESKPQKVINKIKLRYCDGREVDGNWENPIVEFEIQHTAQGIFYNKSLEVDTIREIQVLSWKKIQISEKTEGVSYRFEPYETIMKTKDQKEFRIFSFQYIDELERINLSNDNGRTFAFTIWNDFRSKSGEWYSKMKGLEEKVVGNCYKDVVKQIIFL